jgi:secondary thiamine-phosphate synthase enzyme
MAVKTHKISIETNADVDIVNITKQVQEEVAKSKLKSGTVTVFVSGSTGAISTMEYEPGLIKDFPEALERIAPSDIYYAHHNTWHDDNGKSHVRATFIGPSLTVPFVDGQLTLGTWQQIVFLELDTSSRHRSLILQIIGD